MTDRLDRLERHLDHVLAGPRRLMRSLSKTAIGTYAMTAQNETVAAVLADLKMLVDSDALESVYARLESALTKAEAVEPVEYQVRFRPIFADAAEMTWSKCTREEYENPKLDSLYDKRALYAHAPPAVPVESLGRGVDQPDLLDDLARVYATIPTLPVTADNAEQATAALLAFCYLPSLHNALDAQYLPPSPQGDAEDYLRPLRNAIGVADAYATGGPRNLRIVTLRMDEAEAMLARASLAQNAEAEPERDIYAAYKTWPDDIRKKLSVHDLRRMQGWAPKAGVEGWRIDTSAGGPILVYKDCSVIEGEDARYVLDLIRKDQAPAEPVASVPDGSAILQAIDALQEFKPHAQKHPHARKGFVNSMRKKAATCEGDEYGWVNKGDALMAIARVLVTTTPPTNQEGAAP